MSTISYVSIPSNIHEVLSSPKWHQTMVEEITALYNNTRELVLLSPGKSIVSCCWVYTVKVGSNDQVD